MRAFIILFAVVVTLRAASVTGTILIRKKLTRGSVSSAVSIYERGAAVAPERSAAGKSPEDPLDYERSRVVIWLEGPGAEETDPRHAASAVMRQEGRRFLPDLIAIPAGGAVAFPNLDPIFHNVFSLSRPKIFDLGNYVKGDSRSVTFGKPGIVYVNCHLHPSMAAAIVVTPNRWYARAERNGQYALREVPPGEYTVVAWHKAAGFFRKTVRVGPNADAVADFFIPIGENETLPGPRAARNREGQ